jgi:hypothetical protein
MQDATFSELLRRLQKLDVDPQLPVDAAAMAPSANGDAEDAASQLRAECQSSANIDFAAALDIASTARAAKVWTCSRSPSTIYWTCNWRACCVLTMPCNTVHRQRQLSLLHVQERQAGEDQVQAAAAELLQDMTEDDAQQEPWQPSGADASPQASWHLAGGFTADDFEDANSELDDDLPDADYVVCSIPCVVHDGLSYLPNCEATRLEAN